MPSPRPLHRYPSEFAAFMRQALIFGEAKLNLPNRKAARAWQRHIYTYRDALLLEPDTFPDLTALAPKLKTKIERTDTGAVLHLYIPKPT